MSSPQIHPNASVAASAKLARGVTVGAFAVLGEDVELGAHSVVHPHAVVYGPSRFGEANVFHPFCVVGGDPQDYTFGGEDIDLCDRVGRRHPVIYHPGIIITHFGRISSRQHIGYAYSQTVVGVTRYLQKSGCSRVGLVFYKAALTLDAPLQWLGHAFRYSWRRLRGQSLRAAKSRLVLRGISHFLRRELLTLWRI